MKDEAAAVQEAGGAGETLRSILAYYVSASLAGFCVLVVLNLVATRGIAQLAGATAAVVSYFLISKAARQPRNRSSQPSAAKQ